MDDQRDFAQKERLGLPYRTMIWAICVVADGSKYLDFFLFKSWHIFHFNLGSVLKVVVFGLGKGCHKTTFFLIPFTPTVETPGTPGLNTDLVV